MAEKSDSEATPARAPGGQWTEYAVMGAVCALVIGIFVRGAEPGVLEATDARAGDSYYNLLIQGFRSGHLYVMRDPSPGLATLADPYDPSLNHPYVWDENHLAYEMSYYKGKLYLYFGVVPALVLFWPYEALTGGYLSHKNAVVIFLTMGFLVSAVLLGAIRRRYFPELNIWLVAAGLLALGLAGGALGILASCDVYEVAKSCAFAFVMLALAAIWRALHYPERRPLWLMAASLAYGLAIGSRPSLLMGAVILLFPVIQGFYAGHPETWSRKLLLLAAAAGPLMLVGAGLMLYNDLRFNSPFDFGLNYQLTNQNNDHARQFSPAYFFTNFDFYFLEAVRWGGHFPFIQAPTGSPAHAPPGYHGVRSPCAGILVNSPIVWLAAAAIFMGWKHRRHNSALSWFITAVFFLFAVCAITLCLFFAAGGGYELDFLPPLVLLAAIGILSVEQAGEKHPGGKRMARAVWCLLLGYSLAINLLAAVQAYGAASYFLGNSLLNQGRPGDAAVCFQRALAFEPNSAEAHGGLGNVFSQKGQWNDAIGQYQIAVQLKPDFGEAYNNLGYCFLQQGKPDTAIMQYQKAIELHFDSPNCESGLGDAFFEKRRLPEAVAHYQRALELHAGSAGIQARIRERLGDAFFQMKSLDDAIVQYQKVLEIQPDFAVACNNLGYCFLQQGWLDDAIAQFQKAVKSQPGFGPAYNNLGNAFREKRLPAKAMAAYRIAIEVQPGFVPAYVNLAWILAAWPDAAVRNGTGAVASAEKAAQLTQDTDPSVLGALAAAEAETGRFGDAVATEQKAVALAQKLGDAAVVQQGEERLDLYRAHQACRQFEPDQPSK